MAGAHAAAVVAVEVLVEEEVVLEVGVGLQQLVVAEGGAAAVFVAQQQLGEALAQGRGYLSLLDDAQRRAFDHPPK